MESSLHSRNFSVPVHILGASVVATGVLAAAGTYLALTGPPAWLKAWSWGPAPKCASSPCCTSSDSKCSVRTKNVDDMKSKFSPRFPLNQEVGDQQALSPVNDRRRGDPYDPSPRIGPDKVILGIGYNGFPRGCPDGALPWAKKSRDNDPLGTKYPFVVHAEANALLNKNAASVEGASVYVTMFPCNECAKLMIQAGIREIVYHEEKVQEHVHIDGNEPSTSSLYGLTEPGAKSVNDPCYLASKKLLTMAGLKLTHHRLDRCINVCPQ
eukprot:gene300-1634_t